MVSRRHDRAREDPGTQRAKLGVDDFLLLADAGAFEGYARTELIEGEIWVLNAVHRRCARLHTLMIAALADGVGKLGLPFIVYTNPATRVSDDSLPEPDIVVGEDEDGSVVTLARLRIAVEISESTLAMDLGRKALLYAQAGVPEYWVVDCEHAIVHQMWSPRDGSYAERRQLAGGDRLQSATLPGLSLSLPALS